MPQYLSRDREEKRESYTYALAAWAWMLGLAAFSLMVYASLHYSIGFPYQDEWSVIEELASNHGSYSFNLLWAQHNEHRMAIAKLLVMADLYWFKGRNISLYLELYTMQLVHFLFWGWGLRRVARWPPWMVVMGAGLAAFALFWVSQWESLLNPFVVSSLSAFVGGTIAVMALYFALEDPSKLAQWVAVSIGAAFVAETGLACGLLIWPLLLVLAIPPASPARLRALAIAGLQALASRGCTLPGTSVPPWHANPMESLGKPDVVLSYLYSPTSETAGLTVSPELGKVTCALIGAGGRAGVVCRGNCFGPHRTGSRWRRLSLSVYMAGTGFLTALGRLDFAIAQAGAKPLSDYRADVLAVSGVICHRCGLPNESPKRYAGCRGCSAAGDGDAAGLQWFR